MFVFSAMLTIGVRCRFHGAAWLLEKRRFSSPFVRLVADGWCWFVLREKYCWLVGDGWFVLREKYRWLVADKPNEQGGVPFLFTVR
jgi:hypothetical protein